MKKLLLSLSLIFMAFVSSVYAQDTQPTEPAQKPADATEKPMDQANATTSNLLPMPEPLTIEKIYPVIGRYQSAGSETDGPMTISVNIDPEVKGVAWVEGLPQGKVKALLFKSPATYKIPAQKTEEGKDVAEGTLIYDPETKAISICIGCAYNYKDPASAFAMNDEMADDKTAKNKKKEKKHWVFVGSKVEQSTAANAAPMQ